MAAMTPEEQEKALLNTMFMLTDIARRYARAKKLENVLLEARGHYLGAGGSALRQRVEALADGEPLALTRGERLALRDAFGVLDYAKLYDRPPIPSFPEDGE